MDIDRRMLDFLVGLDTEFSDMVDGSHLYFPSAVQVDDVVLPQDQKKLIVETVENFAAYKKVRKTLGLDKTGQALSDAKSLTPLLVSWGLGGTAFINLHAVCMCTH